MKFIITFSLSVLLSYLSGVFFGWWAFTILVALIHAVYPVKPGMAFLSGFTALLVLWGSLSFYMDWANHHILSKKIALLFLQQESNGYLILITSIIGALLGGLSALTGSLARRMMANG